MSNVSVCMSFILRSKETQSCILRTGVKCSENISRFHDTERWPHNTGIPWSPVGWQVNHLPKFLIKALSYSFKLLWFNSFGFDKYSSTIPLFPIYYFQIEFSTPAKSRLLFFVTRKVFDLDFLLNFVQCFQVSFKTSFSSNAEFELLEDRGIANAPHHWTPMTRIVLGINRWLMNVGSLIAINERL